MNKNTIIVIVLAVLVLIAAVQAVELNQLKAKIVSNDISTSAVTTKTSSSGSGASLPSNLNNLPQMVGGC